MIYIMDVWTIILIFLVILMIAIVISYRNLSQITGGANPNYKWIPWKSGHFPAYIAKQAALFSPLIDFSKLKQMGEVTQYSSLMPWHVPEENRIIAKHIPQEQVKKIFDITGHVGIVAINLATLYPQAQIEVTELDPKVCQVLKYNLETAVGPRAIAICGNGVDHLLGGQEWDLVYFDPPWGGRDYLEAKEMDLILKDDRGHEWSLDQLIHEIHERKLAKYIVFRATLNYAKLEEIKKKYPRVHIEDIRSSLPGGKFGKISYKLVLLEI